MLKKRILTNTFVNSTGKFLSFSLQLFIITYLIKTLGKEAYGIVVLALALVANTNLLEAGFGLSVTKYVAEYRAKGDWKRLLEVVNTNFIVSTVLALIFSGILLLVNELFLEKIFTIPPALLTGTKNLIRILLALSIVEFWSVSIIRVAEGFQRYTLARSMELLKWFLRAVFIVLAVAGGYGLVGVGIAYFCAGLISLVSLYFFVFIRDTNLRLSVGLSTKESFRLLFGFSVWIFLSKVFAFFSYRIDIILIGIFLQPVYLTYYNVAFKIYEFLRFGCSLIASTLIPITSELNALMDKQRLSLLFKKASKYTVLLMYPVLVFFAFYVDRIISLWVGEGFGISVLLAQLFMVSLFFVALVSSGAEMMVGLNRVKELVVYSGTGSLVNLIFSIILIRKIGVYGVVVGTLIGSCVVAAGYLYQMLKRFDATFLELAKDIGKHAAGSIMLGFTLFLVSKNLYAGITIAILYFVFIVTFMVDKDDKKEFLKMFNLKERMLS